MNNKSGKRLIRCFLWGLVWMLSSLGVAISCLAIKNKNDSSEKQPVTSSDVRFEWSAGAGAPTDATISKVLDMYFDTETYDVYKKTSVGWVKIGNLKGQDGKDGVNGTNGKDASNIELRVENGYIQWKFESEQDSEWKKLIATIDLKGKDGVNAHNIELEVRDGYIQWKLDSDDETEWEPLISVEELKGKDGKNGSSFLTGYGIPAGGFGSDEDTYLDLGTMDLYLKIDGDWGTPVANIKGDKGDKGDPGKNVWLNYDGALWIGNKKTSYKLDPVVEDKVVENTLESFLNAEFEIKELNTLTPIAMMNGLLEKTGRTMYSNTLVQEITVYCDKDGKLAIGSAKVSDILNNKRYGAEFNINSRLYDVKKGENVIDLDHLIDEYSTLVIGGEGSTVDVYSVEQFDNNDDIGCYALVDYVNLNGYINKVNEISSKLAIKVKASVCETQSLLPVEDSSIKQECEKLISISSAAELNNDGLGLWGIYENDPENLRFAGKTIRKIDVAIKKITDLDDPYFYLYTYKFEYNSSNGKTDVNSGLPNLNNKAYFELSNPIKINIPKKYLTNAISVPYNLNSWVTIDGLNIEVPEGHSIMFTNKDTTVTIARTDGSAGYHFVSGSGTLFTSNTDLYLKQPSNAGVKKEVIPYIDFFVIKDTSLSAQREIFEDEELSYAENDLEVYNNLVDSSNFVYSNTSTIFPLMKNYSDEANKTRFSNSDIQSIQFFAKDGGLLEIGSYNLNTQNATQTKVFAVEKGTNTIKTNMFINDGETLYIGGGSSNIEIMCSAQNHEPIVKILGCVYDGAKTSLFKQNKEALSQEVLGKADSSYSLYGTNPWGLVESIDNESFSGKKLTQIDVLIKSSTVKVNPTIKLYTFKYDFTNEERTSNASKFSTWGYPKITEANKSFFKLSNEIKITIPLDLSNLETATSYVVDQWITVKNLNIDIPVGYGVAISNGTATIGRLSYKTEHPLHIMDIALGKPYDGRGNEAGYNSVPCIDFYYIEKTTVNDNLAEYYFKDKKLSVIGDSITTTTILNNFGGTEDDTWAKQVANELDMSIVKNGAISGMGVTNIQGRNGIGYVEANKLCVAGSPADIVGIFFGTCDIGVGVQAGELTEEIFTKAEAYYYAMKNGTSTEGLVPTNYAEAYAVAVYTLIQNEKTINNNYDLVVMCCTVPINGNSYNKPALLKGYNDAVRYVAEHYGCFIADFNSAGFTVDNYIEKTTDDGANTHPNIEGMDMLTAQFIKDMIATVDKW